MTMHDRNQPQNEDATLRDIRAVLAAATPEQLHRLMHDIRMAAPVASHPARKDSYDA
jgi:hypothetical protein